MGSSNWATGERCGTLIIFAALVVTAGTVSLGEVKQWNLVLPLIAQEWGPKQDPQAVFSLLITEID